MVQESMDPLNKGLPKINNPSLMAFLEVPNIQFRVVLVHF
jgi:hypothetical protein